MHFDWISGSSALSTTELLNHLVASVGWSMAANLQGAFARCSCQAAHAGSSPSLMHFFNLTFILHFSEWLWSGQGVTVKSGYWLNLRLCSAACHDCYIRAHSIPQYPTSYNVVTPLSTIESLQRVKIDVNMSSPYTRTRCHSYATPCHGYATPCHR